MGVLKFGSPQFEAYGSPVLETMGVLDCVFDRDCPVAESLGLIGERWTLLIVRDLLRGPKRFQDLQEMQEGITPAMLSQRLKELEQAEIVTRRFYSDHPPRAEYFLTPKGEELQTVVMALGIWGAKHAGYPHRMLHAACSRPVGLQLYCPACGDALTTPTELADYEGKLPRRDDSDG